MKTSDVSSKRPVQTDAKQSTQAQQKGKPKREFKEVLQESGAPRLQGRKNYPGLEKNPPGKGDLKEKEAGEKSKMATEPLTPRGITRKDHDVDEKPFKQEMKKESKPEEPPLAVTNPAIIGPATVENKAQIEKAASHPALNIKELESIVKQVQIGVNEKGLAECRFELQTKNLGNLDLKVNAENDQIRIEFATQDAAAQEMLQKNLTELSQMLQAKGLNLAETNFTNRDQQSSRDDQQSSEQRQSDDSDIQVVGPGEKRRKAGLPVDESDTDYTV